MKFTGITDEEQLNLALLLGRTASYISTHGNYDLVAQREEKSLEVKTRFLKKEDDRVLDLMSQFASTYRDQGSLTKAEEMEVEIVAIRKKVHGTVHLETLNGMTKLALTYNHQGQFEKIVDLLMKVLRTIKRVFGPEYRQTLMIMENLGLKYDPPEIV